MPLSLIDANKVIEKAHAKAAQLDIKVTVAVVDEGGLLIALGRMDGAAPLSPQIAEAKAVGAANLSGARCSLPETGLGAAVHPLSAPLKALALSPGCAGEMGAGRGRAPRVAFGRRGRVGAGPPGSARELPGSTLSRRGFTRGFIPSPIKG